MNIIIIYILYMFDVGDDDVNGQARKSQKVFITNSVTVNVKFCNLPKYIILLQSILFAA